MKRRETWKQGIPVVVITSPQESMGTHKKKPIPKPIHNKVKSRANLSSYKREMSPRLLARQNSRNRIPLPEKNDQIRPISDCFACSVQHAPAIRLIDSAKTRTLTHQFTDSPTIPSEVEQITEKQDISYQVDRETAQTQSQIPRVSYKDFGIVDFLSQKCRLEEDDPCFFSSQEDLWTNIELKPPGRSSQTSLDLANNVIQDEAARENLSRQISTSLPNVKLTTVKTKTKWRQLRMDSGYISLDIRPSSSLF